MSSDNDFLDALKTKLCNSITGKTDTQVQLNTEYNLEQKDIEKLLEDTTKSLSWEMFMNIDQAEQLLSQTISGSPY